MTRSSYRKTIDAVLAPLGFRREGDQWTRMRGDIQEKVDLQKSSIAGVTVNLFAKDLETVRILSSIPCEFPIGIIQIGLRIGQLIDGYDRWWKNDPDGPRELAELVRVHAVPWFDRVRSLEDQASKWYYRETPGRWKSPNNPALAVTLYRLGELDEALALFDEPVPKTAVPRFVAKNRCVLRWLQERKREIEGAASSGQGTTIG